MSYEFMGWPFFRIPLHFRTDEFIRPIRPIIAFGERLHMPAIFRTNIAWQPAYRFVGLVITIYHLKQWWRRISFAEFAALVKITTAHKTTSSIQLAGGNSFASEHPFAARVHLIDNTTAITVPIAFENSRYLLH